MAAKTTRRKPEKPQKKAKKAAKKAARKPSAKARPAKPEPNKPRLLSGGNPQIAKADGDEPVQAYLAAIPDWKRAVGVLLDRLIEREVPGVKKAVRWNTPFYGMEGNGWFIAFHCITKYMKVTFFKGAQLHPLPPVASKVKDVRYLHLYEGESIDEAQLAHWIRQAAALPGERCF